MTATRRTFLAGSAALAAAPLVAQSVLVADESPEPASLGKTKNTRFAVNVEMWWSKLPFLDRLKKAAELGFPAVEFWPHQGKDLAAIAKLSQELDLEIAQFTAWGFRPGMNDPKQEDAFVAAIEQGCQVAHQLKCRKMTVVAGDNQPGMTKDQMHEQCIKALKRAAPIAEREKVMLILEPMNGRVDHPGHCLYGSEDAIKICKAVDSPMVKINWDLYHMQIEDGDLAYNIRETAEWITHFNVAGVPTRNEIDATQEVNWRYIAEVIADLDYDGYVSHEWRPTPGRDPLESIATAIAIMDV